MWGKPFNDEIDPTVAFTRPYLLAMANAGPNTNGSQFFITVLECPWLNGKHTIFGQATAGMDTIHKIERAKVNKDHRPLTDIRIINIEVRSSGG